MSSRASGKKVGVSTTIVANLEKASHAWGWAREQKLPGVVSPWPKIANLWQNIPKTKKRAYWPEEMEAALQRRGAAQ